MKLKKKFFFMILVITSACESSNQVDVKSLSNSFPNTYELIGDRKVDSVLVEKLKAGTSGDNFELTTLSDSISLSKIKNSLNKSKGRMMKFVPKYKIVVYCSDTIIDLGFSKPNKIISNGSTSIVDSVLTQIIFEVE